MRIIALEILSLKVFTDNKFLNHITINSILREIKIISCVAYYQIESYNNCAVAEITQCLGYMISMDLNQISTIKDYLNLWEIT